MSVCSREALIVRGRVSFRSIGVRLCVEMLKCFLCVEKNVIGLYNKQNAQQYTCLFWLFRAYECLFNVNCGLFFFSHGIVHNYQYVKCLI